MGFYELFVEKYDKLFPWEGRVKRESRFYREVFSENKVRTVLDCACGTGQDVIMLNKMGYKARGSDISSAMIQKAKSNSRTHGVKTAFEVSDFRALTKTFSERFDAVVCVGNSLPHLTSGKDLAKALSEMYGVMGDDGILILQQRNYDMLLKRRPRFVPMTAGKNESFFYLLDYYPNKIIFNVVSLNNRTGKFNVFKAAYAPLRKAALSKLLRKAGFSDMKFYGGYDFRKFDVGADEYLVVTAKK